MPHLMADQQNIVLPLQLLHHNDQSNHSRHMELIDHTHHDHRFQSVDEVIIGLTPGIAVVVLVLISRSKLVRERGREGQRSRRGERERAGLRED